MQISFVLGMIFGGALAMAGMFIQGRAEVRKVNRGRPVPGTTDSTEEG